MKLWPTMSSVRLKQPIVFRYITWTVHIAALLTEAWSFMTVRSFSSVTPNSVESTVSNSHASSSPLSGLTSKDNQTKCCSIFQSPMKRTTANASSLQATWCFQSVKQTHSGRISFLLFFIRTLCCVLSSCQIPFTSNTCHH